MNWLTKILGDVTGTVNKVVQDRDLAAKLTAELNGQLLETGLKTFQAEVDAQSKVIIAEAGGGSWMQRSWRPSLMFTFIAIIANNYLFAPYAKLFWPGVPVLTLPPEMWTMLSLGMSGYITGRTVEKGLEIWKRKTDK
jgi:hypothetical protein